jgi:hypothetical protein
MPYVGVQSANPATPDLEEHRQAFRKDKDAEHPLHPVCMVPVYFLDDPSCSHRCYQQYQCKPALPSR